MTSFILCIFAAIVALICVITFFFNKRRILKTKLGTYLIMALEHSRDISLGKNKSVFICLDDMRRDFMLSDANNLVSFNNAAVSHLRRLLDSQNDGFSLYTKLDGASMICPNGIETLATVAFNDSRVFDRLVALFEKNFESIAGKRSEIMQFSSIVRMPYFPADLYSHFYERVREFQKVTAS